MELREWIEKTLTDLKSLLSLNNVDISTLTSLIERMTKRKDLEYVVDSSLGDEGVALKIDKAQVEIIKGNLNGILTIVMPYHRIEEYVIDLEDAVEILSDFYTNFIKPAECA